MGNLNYELTQPWRKAIIGREMVPSKIWYIAQSVVLVCAKVSSVVFAESLCPGIHVEVLNIENSTGTVACALFDSPKGFPKKFMRSARSIMVSQILKTEARCDFLDIPPGSYAIAVIHDENMDGKLETNFLGVPKEGYGFSNDAKGMIGAPSFSAAGFSYDGKNLDMTISLRY